MLHGGWDPCVHQASNESWARTATQKTSLCGRGRNCQERSQENRHGPVGNSSYLWKSSVSYIPCLPAVHLMQRSPWHVAKRVRPSMKDSWDISPWICHGVFHTPGIEDSLTLSQALGLPLPSWSSTLLCYYAGVWICYPKTDGCSWMFESLAFGSRNRFFQSVPRRCLFSPLCLFLSLSLSSVFEILSDVSGLQLKRHGHDIWCCMLLLFFFKVFAKEWRWEPYLNVITKLLCSVLLCCLTIHLFPTVQEACKSGSVTLLQVQTCWCPTHCGHHTSMLVRTNRSLGDLTRT